MHDLTVLPKLFLFRDLHKSKSVLISIKEDHCCADSIFAQLFFTDPNEKFESRRSITRVLETKNMNVLILTFAR